MFKVNIKSKYLSSCVIALWIAIAGKFCSTSSCARAIHLCTDFTKIMTYNIQYYMLNLNKCCRVHYSKLISQLLYIFLYLVEFQNVQQFKQLSVFLIVLQFDIVLLETMKSQFGIVIHVDLHWLKIKQSIPTTAATAA